MSFDHRTFLDALGDEFQRMANPAIAKQQKEYLRGKFDYFGIKTPQRREAQKPFLQKEFLPHIDEMPGLIKEIWERPQRDFQMFGVDLMLKYKKQLRHEDLDWLVYSIVTKSWWDSVDAIAVHQIGSYFQLYPSQISKVVPKWMASENMWLQRTCVIFQLKYKKELDVALLGQVIEQLLGSKEFFINKAIGWVLREYGKTNPDWVVDFANNHELSGLSRREALRIIQSK